MMLDKACIADIHTGETLRMSNIVTAATATRPGIFYGSHRLGSRTLTHAVCLSLRDLEGADSTSISGIPQPTALLSTFLTGRVFRNTANHVLREAYKGALSEHVLQKLVTALQTAFLETSRVLLAPIFRSMSSPLLTMHSVEGCTLWDGPPTATDLRRA